MKFFIITILTLFLLFSKSAEACEVSFGFDESKSKPLITKKSADYFIPKEIKKASEFVVESTIFDSPKIALIAYDELLREKGVSIETLDEYTYRMGDASIFINSASTRIMSSINKYTEDNLSSKEKEKIMKMDKLAKLKLLKNLAKAQRDNPEAIRPGLIKFGSLYGCSSDPTAFAERVLARL